MRMKRTYHLPERTVRAVRELAATCGVADTDDGDPASARPPDAAV